MVYLAILLILCGLLILITALSIETGKVPFEGSIKSRGIKNTPGFFSAGSQPADFESEEIDIIFPGDRLDKINSNIGKDNVSMSFNDETYDVNVSDASRTEDPVELLSSAYKRVPQRIEPHRNERSNPDLSVKRVIAEKIENTPTLHKSNDTIVSAIMFDDRSNIIDYESGIGVIDSTFSKYKSIKRIGKGKIESDFDGVNFYLDEKLYRFDFHKVYDIWSGSNYIALPLKGNSTVKLFIIEHSAGFPEKVEANFKEYEKGL